MAIEPNIGGSNDGEVIFGCGFVNLSDRALKENVRVVPEEELQETFDAVEPQLFDRIDGGREQIGFVAQDVRLAGSLARRCARRRIWTAESSWLSTTRSSRSCVVKKLQKLVEALEGLRKMAEEEAIGLFQQLARDFNVRDLGSSIRSLEVSRGGRTSRARACGIAQRRSAADFGVQAAANLRRRSRTTACRRISSISVRIGHGRVH
eukprot:s10442_g3.t1